MDLTPTGVGWKGWGQINRFTSAARFQNFRKQKNFCKRAKRLKNRLLRLERLNSVTAEEEHGKILLVAGMGPVLSSQARL